MKWHDKVTPPSEKELRYIGANNWEAFIQHSENMVPPLFKRISELIGPINDGTSVLDFGCGVGRVAQKMSHDHNLPTHGCDINEGAIEYLKSQIKGPEFTTTSYSPPLPYETDFFDLVYSISIWTHLPPDMQLPWLQEIHRITKPGGTALISVSSESSLAIRQERLKGWNEYNKEDIKDQGIIYVEYPGLVKSPESFPGIEGSYGSTLVNLDYIKETWGNVFNDIEIEELAVGNSQDLVILTKSL